MIGNSSPGIAYTVTDWVVKPGAEDEFVREWTTFSEWLLDDRGAESFALMTESRERRRFVTLGVWSAGRATAPWPQFLERLGRCRALCEKSQSRTCRLVSASSHDGDRRSLDLVA